MDILRLLYLAIGYVAGALSVIIPLVVHLIKDGMTQQKA